jgi:autotransporter-associated beta strand protein
MLFKSLWNRLGREHSAGCSITDHARNRSKVRPLRCERLEDRRLLTSISGLAFDDRDANGLKGPGESGQSGWMIYLDANGNGYLDAGETATTTLADGRYRFDGLVPGTYKVAEVQQPGWQQTYPTAIAPALEAVSRASDGTAGNGYSRYPSISADGRYVAFDSSANNLVPGDTNGKIDVFVYDRQTGTIERVSVASDGTQGNGHSVSPSISADGRYVAFDSPTNNLAPGDTNGMYDVFVYDRQTDTIERVSAAFDGTQGNGDSDSASISDDGRYVTFESSANNLVPGDTNGQEDVFVYDCQMKTIERVSVASDGTQTNNFTCYPSISADGRYMAFQSLASNLVPGDTNGKYDAFVYDRQTDTIERVSVASDGTQGSGSSVAPSISADGRYVAFQSTASNLVPGDTNGQVDIFVYDRQTHAIERVGLAADGTQGNNQSYIPSISADGRYVAFQSQASNLVPGDTNGQVDVFVCHRQTNAIERVSLAADGTQGNNTASEAAISADGRYVSFMSTASNLFPGDTNGALDIFTAGNPLARVPGSHAVTLADGQAASEIDFGNTSTKFFVVSDAVRLVCNVVDHSSVDVFLNNNDMSPTYTVALATFGQWQISGGAGDDQLIIDFSNGNPLPSDGLSYDGGLGTNKVTLKSVSGLPTMNLTADTISLSGLPAMRYTAASVVLAGVNTYQGGTIVTRGKLTVSNSSALADGGRLTIGSDVNFNLAPSPVITSNATSAAISGGAVAGAAVSSATSTPSSGLVLSTPRADVALVLDRVKVPVSLVVLTPKIAQGLLADAGVTLAMFERKSSKSLKKTSPFDSDTDWLALSGADYQVPRSTAHAPHSLPVVVFIPRFRNEFFPLRLLYIIRNRRMLE